MIYNNVVAFDFGVKNIGVAVGQIITKTAKPIKTLKTTKCGAPNWLQVKNILNEWKPDILIVGLPLNMNGGDLQVITNKSRKFADCLYIQFNIEVILYDERFSTAAARSDIFENRGGYRALQKCQLDSESAVIILESWLRQYFIN